MTPLIIEGFYAQVPRGATIFQAVAEGIAQASRRGLPVWFIFQDVMLTAYPGSDAAKVIEDYASKRETRLPEGLRSDAETRVLEAAKDAFNGQYQVDVHINLVNATRAYLALNAAPQASATLSAERREGGPDTDGTRGDAKPGHAGACGAALDTSRSPLAEPQGKISPATVGSPPERR